MFPLIAALAAPPLAIAAITKYYLGSAENHNKYVSEEPLFFNSDPESDGVKAVSDYLRDMTVFPSGSPDGSKEFAEKLAAKRELIDNIGREATYDNVSFKEFTLATDAVPQMSAEWVLTKSTNPARRILYVHGGAFTVGSRFSHRPITAALAELTGCAICVVDYRLMPEAQRVDCVADIKAAYKWVLGNGPDGENPAEKIGISGDSAGGNLCMMLSNWTRDSGVRPPDAAALLSPLADATFSAPSINENFGKDLMLTPLFVEAIKVPRWVVKWISWKQQNVSPGNPEISPLFAKLHDLPPTLIQASQTEMIRDDSIRYKNKALKAGSDVTFQLWNHMPHVWQVFPDMLPEAKDAMSEIRKFFAAHGVKG